MAGKKGQFLELYRRHAARKRMELEDCFEEERKEWESGISALEAQVKQVDDGLAELNHQDDQREDRVNEARDLWTKALQEYRSTIGKIERERENAGKAFKTILTTTRQQLQGLLKDSPLGQNTGEGPSQEVSPLSQEAAKENNQLLLEKLILLRQRIKSLPPKDEASQKAEEAKKLQLENQLLADVIEDLKRRKDGAQRSHQEQLQSELNWLKLELIDPSLVDPYEICDDED